MLKKRNKERSTWETIFYCESSEANNCTHEWQCKKDLASHAGWL